MEVIKTVDDRTQRQVVRSQLPNGLRVTLLPMAGFHKTYAMLTTDFGSVDNHFTPVGQKQAVTLPDGVAHFLEHKLFEKQDHDAFDLFGDLGADANAFTTFTQTSYLFSTTTNLKANLAVLLDFVFDPYFTAQTVAKEQGIIGAEIRMYADNPANRLYMGTLENLYPHDPYHLEIAGSEASIQAITPAMLYQAYETFYQPANMELVLAGNLVPAEVMEWLDNNQTLASRPKVAVPRHDNRLVDPQGHDVLAFRTTNLATTVRPKIMVGLRGLPTFTSGRDRLAYVQAVNLGLDLLFDDTAAGYQELYDQGIIDDSFDYSFEMERGAHFATFATETDQREAFADAIIDRLHRSPQLLDQAAPRFKAVQRGLIGQLLLALDSPERQVNRYAGRLFDGATIFDELAVIQKLDLAAVKRAMAQFVGPERLTVYQVLPAQSEG